MIEKKLEESGEKQDERHLYQCRILGKWWKMMEKVLEIDWAIEEQGMQRGREWEEEGRKVWHWISCGVNEESRRKNEWWKVVGMMAVWWIVWRKFWSWYWKEEEKHWRYDGRVWWLEWQREMWDVMQKSVKGGQKEKEEWGGMDVEGTMGLEEEAEDACGVIRKRMVRSRMKDIYISARF